MRYALIDAASSPDTPKALAFHTPGYKARSLFARQPEARHADSGPWLAVLDGNSGLDSWLRALQLRPGAVAILESQAGFEQVFEHLEQCLDMRLPSGELAMLRYWDGRVFLRLQGVLSDEQKRALLGPVQSWTVRLLGRTFVATAQGLEQAA